MSASFNVRRNHEAAGRPIADAIILGGFAPRRMPDPDIADVSQGPIQAIGGCPPLC